jgi:hypothetical protein
MCRNISVHQCGFISDASTVSKLAIIFQHSKQKLDIWCDSVLKCTNIAIYVVAMI